MLSHYISTTGGDVDVLENLLDKLMLNVEERSICMECVDMTDYYDEVTWQVAMPSDIVMGYMVEKDSMPGWSTILEQFLIQEEKEDKKNLFWNICDLGCPCCCFLYKRIYLITMYSESSIDFALYSNHYC